MRGRSRQIAVVVAALFNVAMNALAGAGLLFGVETGAVSDAVPTGVTPAGWTFAVWSVIFFGVLVFAAWQARPATRGARYDALGVPFVAANVLTGLWQVPWLLEHFAVAAVVLAGIVASLAVLYLRLDRLALRGSERWALGVPTSLFLAWTSVALALNVSVALVAAGWAPTSVVWPVVLVLVVAGIGAWLVGRTADAAFVAVLLWAFAGIAARQGGTALTIALGLAALAVVGALIAGKRAGRSLWPTAHAVA